MKLSVPSIVTITVSALLLGACTGDRAIFTAEKSAPDEFAVYSRAPLSLPPDFGLRPPTPGATRPQVIAPRNDARDALIGSRSSTLQKQAEEIQARSDLSPGMQAILRLSGADKAEPNIRDLVNKETAALSGVGSEETVDKILFWRNSGVIKGAVLDAEAEQRRLNRKEVEGESIIETSPTIRRRGDKSGEQSGTERRGEEKGFWGSLFD